MVHQNPKKSLKSQAEMERFMEVLSQGHGVPRDHRSDEKTKAKSIAEYIRHSFQHRIRNSPDFFAM